MLTPNQSMFCLEFVNSGNATKSYLQSFGTDNYESAKVAASQLLRKKSIKMRISELQAEMENEKIATSAELQQLLTRIIRREETDSVFLPNGTTAEKRVAVRDVLKAAELLLKIQGAFVTKHEVEVKDVPIIIDDYGRVDDDTQATG